MDSLPPAAAPWRESLPWCSRRGSASPWRGPAGGAQNAGGSGKRPYKGTGRGGYDRPSPLEKGAVAAKGGDWGFLVSCRGHGERRRKKPSVTASPCHLPFQGRFLAGGHCPPLRMAGSGRELYVSIHLFPKIVPHRAKNRAECTAAYTQPDFAFGGEFAAAAFRACPNLPHKGRTFNPPPGPWPPRWPSAGRPAGSPHSG